MPQIDEFFISKHARKCRLHGVDADWLAGLHALAQARRSIWTPLPTSLSWCRRATAYHHHRAQAVTMPGRALPAYRSRVAIEEHYVLKVAAFDDSRPFSRIRRLRHFAAAGPPRRRLYTFMPFGGRHLNGRQ